MNSFRKTQFIIHFLILFSIVCYKHLTHAQSIQNSVDTLMVIAVDVSGSINDREYQIQKSGIVDALKSKEMSDLLVNCNGIGLGLTVVEWSGTVKSSQVLQIVPWTLLQTENDLIQFSDQIANSPRSFAGDTDIAAALNYSLQVMQSAPFESTRRIIAISGDGSQSVSSLSRSYDLETMRRIIVLENEIIINAIAISENSGELIQQTRGVQTPSIKDYFEENVKGGPGSFVLPADSFESYSDVIKRQLLQIMNTCIA